MPPWLERHSNGYKGSFGYKLKSTLLGFCIIEIVPVICIHDLLVC